VAAVNATPRDCTVCGRPLTRRIADWTLRCDGCGTWHSTLPEMINSHLTARIDDEARTIGLEGLRRANARQVLEALGGDALAGRRLLDVGSAYGWFLEEAARLGLVAVGVEPDETVAEMAIARGLDVLVGFFPGAVPPGQRFDFVTFNDVLEHVPDVRGVLRGVHDVLAPGGRVVVNIPNANGLAYRAACTLARAGASGPFERLWQRGLPSPHMHYFPPAALKALVGECGFDVESVRPLQSITRRGLWERLHMVRDRSPASVALYAALWAAADVLNRPACSDIFLLVATRRD
jgi:SAM-dependent methyltransferase